MNHYAEFYATSIGTEIDSFLASGDFGEAYLTTDNKVIKITSDVSEFVVADSLKHRNYENTVDIYDTAIFDSGVMVVYQEFLDTEGIEDLFNEILLEAEAQEVEILEIDERDFVYGLSDEAYKMLNDLCYSVFEIQKRGFNPIDIHHNNIGLKENGNYGLFDQKDVLSEEFLNSFVKDYKEKSEPLSFFQKTQRKKIKI